MMDVKDISDRLDELLVKELEGIILNEYTKSVYLTNAQSMYVSRILGEYEYGDTMRHLLGSILKHKSQGVFSVGTIGRYSVNLEPSIKKIVYESFNNTTTIPLKFNDIHNTLKNPFRKPNEVVSYRVLMSSTVVDIVTDIIGPSEYFYVYCVEPKPIVLEDLPDGLEINSIATATSSELPTDSVIRILDIAKRMIIEDRGRLTQENLVPSEGGNTPPQNQ